MRYACIAFALSLFCCAGCGNNETKVESTSVQTDTVTGEKVTVSKDSPAQQAVDIYNNPYRNINNFDFKTGNRFTDSMHAAYLAEAQVTVHKDICVGDMCIRYETLKKNDDNTMLYFFKGDGGEYGFSNDQFMLKNDSLYFVRNFSVSIKEWPKEHSKTVWEIEERTYLFEYSKVKGTSKVILTEDLASVDYTMRDVAIKTLAPAWKATYKAKIEELKNLLAMEEDAKVN